MDNTVGERHFLDNCSHHTSVCLYVFKLHTWIFTKFWLMVQTKKKVFSLIHCLCVWVLSPILDSSTSMILLTDSCISKTYRGAKGEGIRIRWRRGGGERKKNTIFPIKWAERNPQAVINNATHATGNCLFACASTHGRLCFLLLLGNVCGWALPLQLQLSGK